MANPLKQSDCPNLGYVIIETAATPEDAEPAKIIRSDSRNNRVLAEGTVQEANEKNRNGRWYDSRDLFPQLTCPRTMELLKTGNMRAENGHPLDTNLVRQQTIDPEKTVAIFTKFWTEGNLVKAQFRGTNDARGAEFNQDLLDGFSPSWSLRAMGSIQNTKRGAEVKNVRLITYDRVIYPSHSKAYTDGIVQEGSNILLQDNDPGMVIPITNPSVIDYIRSESCNLKFLKESFDLLYDRIDIVDDKYGAGKQVKLTDRAGGIFVVNLESYIHNEIMNACSSLSDLLDK